MDRSYSSKVRKSPKDTFEASTMPISRLSGQSKKRPVSSFAGNDMKKKGEVTKDKTTVSGVAKPNYGSTCGTVNPLPKTSAATDQSKRSDISPTTTDNKKRLPPSIKAPIYPSSLLQHRITSCPVRRRSSEILAKSRLSPNSNLPVRAPPVRTAVKPNAKKNSQPSLAKGSSTTKDDTTKQSSQYKPQPITKKQSSQNKLQPTITKKQSSQNKPQPTITKKQSSQNKPQPTITKEQSSQNKPQPITTSVSKTKKVIFTQETPSPQENSSTITDDQPHPTANNVGEDNSEMTSEEKSASPTLSSPVVKRICSARGRGIVNPPSKYDDSCDDDGDSINEYEENYEDDSDGSYSETEVEEESRQSRAATPADDNWPSSSANTGQQHSSLSPNCIDDDECQSAAGEENETSSLWEDAPSPVSCSFTANMAACPSAAGGTVKRKVPLYRRKSVFPFFSPIMDIPNTCSLQKLSRETPVHTAAPPTESAEESTSDDDQQATLAALDEMHEQLKVIVPAAPNEYPNVASTNDGLNDQPKAVNDGSNDDPQGESSKKNEEELYYEMLCRFDYTPLKPIADDLIVLHTDLAPTEICPTLNRSPSFIGEHNREDGLMSGRSSPKLDIPKDRYCGHMIAEHPLAKYTQKMEKPDQNSSVSVECSGEGDKRGVAAKDDLMQAKTAKQGENYPTASSVEESSSKTMASESHGNKETERQVVEYIEDHPVASGEGEDSCKNSGKASAESGSHDSKDNVEAEHQQVLEHVEDHPIVSGEGGDSSKSSGKASVESEGHDSMDKAETEHQQEVEDHPIITGEGEAFSSSSSSSNEATSIENGGEDNMEQIADHAGDYSEVPSSSSNSEAASIEKGSQDSKENIETEVLEHVEDHPIVPETSVESERCDGKDNVEVYTLEQLAASFGHSVKMEGDTSSKKQKKHKPVPKYNSYEQWYAKHVAKEKAARQPSPILRTTSYKEACMQRQKVYLEKVQKCYSTPLKPPVPYKPSQTQFSKKLTLPPIVKPQQSTVCHIPTPPTEAPPTSGPLSAVRNIRRKQYQKKSLKEAVKLVPAHLANYMLDSPQRCIEYAENLEKVKRKQQYSESLRQKQLMTWANKRQPCTRAQP